MDETEMRKALTVFEGIASGDPDLATRYVHPGQFVQHHPFIADGISGLRDYIGSLPPGHRHLQVVRAFQDQHFVFTQAAGSVLDQNIFFNVFKFENGRIIEQWAFSDKGGAPNKSGHTQNDGPTVARPDQDTEKNKMLIRDYYEVVHISGHHDEIAKYVWEGCIRHEPGVSDGMAAFIRDLQAATRDGKASRSIDEIRLLLGQGDFVFIAAIGSVASEACIFVDLYRIDDAKIVEHWGFPQRIPSLEQCKNGNGIV